MPNPRQKEQQIPFMAQITHHIYLSRMFCTFMWPPSSLPFSWLDELIRFTWSSCKILFLCTIQWVLLFNLEMGLQVFASASSLVCQGQWAHSHLRMYLPPNCLLCLKAFGLCYIQGQGESTELGGTPSCRLGSDTGTRSLSYLCSSLSFSSDFSQLLQENHSLLALLYSPYRLDTTSIQNKGQPDQRVSFQA